jgi:hypothetical protein
MSSKCLFARKLLCHVAARSSARLERRSTLGRSPLASRRARLAVTARRLGRHDGCIGKGSSHRCKLIEKLITNTLLLSHHGIPLVLDIVVGTIFEKLCHGTPPVEKQTSSCKGHRVVREQGEIATPHIPTRMSTYLGPNVRCISLISSSSSRVHSPFLIPGRR